MLMPASLNRMIYIDDSGHPASGLIVYGWIEFTPAHWASVLKNWLDTRKRLWRELGIPVPQELHTTDYVNGRGRITKSIPARHMHNGAPHWKDLGREVACLCLDTIRSTEGLSVGSVYRRVDPSAFAQSKQDTYRSLVNRFERDLEQTGPLGLIFMDGDGSDTSYRSTRRQLPLSQRRIIEDAVHLDSSASQLIQMADLVAWSANAAIDRHDAQSFAWDWYRNYLAERDLAREPQPI